MPVLDANTVDFTSSGPEQTRRMGARQGEILHSSDLGTGKTKA